MGYHTNEKLSDVEFNREDNGKVISGLDPNKAYGYMLVFAY